MTQIEEFEEQLAELKANKDFLECFEMVEYLMYKIVDTNQLYRGADRAIAKHITDKDLRMQIYGDAIQEKMKGDKYTQSEREFIRGLGFTNKEIRAYC